MHVVASSPLGGYVGASVPDSLRYVDPTPRPGWFARLDAAIAATHAGRWISRRFFWRLDPILLRLTVGRLATTLVFPAAVIPIIRLRPRST